MTRKNSRPDVFHSTHEAFTLPVKLREVLKERYQNGVEDRTPFSTKIQEMFFADESICSAVAEKVDRKVLVYWRGAETPMMLPVVHIWNNGRALVLLDGQPVYLDKEMIELVGEVEDNV